MPLCRYHLLKPDYIHFRIRELQRSFALRVLLCHVDVDDVVEPLQQVTRAAIANQLTLVCAWSELVRSPLLRHAFKRSQTLQGCLHRLALQHASFTRYLGVVLS